MQGASSTGLNDQSCIRKDSGLPVLNDQTSETSVNLGLQENNSDYWKEHDQAVEVKIQENANEETGTVISETKRALHETEYSASDHRLCVEPSQSKPGEQKSCINGSHYPALRSVTFALDLVDYFDYAVSITPTPSQDSTQSVDEVPRLTKEDTTLDNDEFSQWNIPNSFDINYKRITDGHRGNIKKEEQLAQETTIPCDDEDKIEAPAKGEVDTDNDCLAQENNPWHGKYTDGTDGPASNVLSSGGHSATDEAYLLNQTDRSKLPAESTYVMKHTGEDTKSYVSKSIETDLFEPGQQITESSTHYVIDDMSYTRGKTILTTRPYDEVRNDTADTLGDQRLVIGNTGTLSREAVEASHSLNVRDRFCADRQCLMPSISSSVKQETNESITVFQHSGTKNYLEAQTFGNADHLQVSYPEQSPLKMSAPVARGDCENCSCVEEVIDNTRQTEQLATQEKCGHDSKACKKQGHTDYPSKISSIYLISREILSAILDDVCMWGDSLNTESVVQPIGPGYEGPFRGSSDTSDEHPIPCAQRLRRDGLEDPYMNYVGSSQEEERVEGWILSPIIPIHPSSEKLCLLGEVEKDISREMSTGSCGEEIVSVETSETTKTDAFCSPDKSSQERDQSVQKTPQELDQSIQKLSQELDQSLSLTELCPTMEGNKRGDRLDRSHNALSEECNIREISWHAETHAKDNIPESSLTKAVEVASCILEMPGIENHTSDATATTLAAPVKETQEEIQREIQDLIEEITEKIELTLEQLSPAAAERRDQSVCSQESTDYPTFTKASLVYSQSQSTLLEPHCVKENGHGDVKDTIDEITAISCTDCNPLKRQSEEVDEVIPQKIIKSDEEMNKGSESLNVAVGEVRESQTARGQDQAEKATLEIPCCTARGQTEDQTVPGTSLQVAPIGSAHQSDVVEQDIVSLYGETSPDSDPLRLHAEDANSTRERTALEISKRVHRQSFEWKYTPSLDFDCTVPVAEADADDDRDKSSSAVVPSVLPLATCHRPRRVGLSRRYRPTPLHPNYARRLQVPAVNPDN